MGTGRRYRLARERAACALLAYLDDRTADTERALLAATHDLEAVAMHSRRARRVPREPRPRATLVEVSR